jgi:hypothetical protein
MMPWPELVRLYRLTETWEKQRNVAGYTLMQHARATEANHRGGIDPRVEVWHYAGNRLAHIAESWMHCVKPWPLH